MTALGAALATTPGLVSLIVPAVKALAVAAIAPEVIVPLVVVGGTFAAYQAWQYWSKENSEVIQDKAKQKYIQTHSADPVLGYEVYVNYIQYFSDGTAPTYIVKNKVPFYTEALGTTLSTSGPCTDGPSKGLTVVVKNADGSTNRTYCSTAVWPISSIEFQLETVPPLEWKNWPEAKRVEAINQLSEDDWKEVAQSMPQGGILQPGQTLPKDVIVTGDPQIAYPGLQIPAIIPAGTIVPQSNSGTGTGTGTGTSTNTGTDTVTNGVTHTTYGADGAITSTTVVSHANGATTTTTTTTNPEGTTTTQSQTASPSNTNTGTNTGTVTLDDIWTKLNGIENFLPLIPALGATVVAPKLPSLAQIESAAAAGSCKSLQQGGCSGSQLPGMNSKLDDLINGLGLAGQAAQGGLLTAMNATLNALNTKIGSVPLVGGVTGALNNIINSSITDRVVNLVIMAGVIHNCMMLSTSIADTFFEALDNIFAIPTLIKDPNGETIDTKETFTKYLDSYFATLFGDTEWKAIKAQWKAYSTIYRAGANIVSSVKEIAEETHQIQDVTRNWVAELGNSLQDDGVIGDDNWEPKNPKTRFRSKRFSRLYNIAEGLENVEEAVESLEEVTSSLRNVVEEANEIKENLGAIEKAVGEANAAAKTDREAKIEGLEIPNFSLEDLVKEE